MKTPLFYPNRLLAAVVIPALVAAAVQAAPIAYDLQVHLEPDDHRLRATATLALTGPTLPVLRLAPQARIEAVTVDGVGAAHAFSRGELRLTGKAPAGPLRLQVRYSAVFNDPIPQRPLNTDNPGFGVDGTILPEGTFLLPGSGWYPQLQAEAVTYTVAVTAPQGMLAVTAGRCLGHQTRDGQTVSTWAIDFPVRGLALSAARYVVDRRQSADGLIATYFLPSSRDLAPAYLEAVDRYLGMYSGLFGPYPFGQFSVVENFFPTGYGFASYTLLGSAVLRLPFIIDTSLGHEVAHCWWGNGVWVAPRQGNWSEGLTTYVADYLYKEVRSLEEARQYRLDWLRNITALVDETAAFPLSDFASRTDPVTKAIGYDKAAMVFHMLRGQVGDAVFWQALRRLFATRAFTPTGWTEIQAVFETQSGQSLGWFFDQWVRQKGNPRLFLADVQTRRTTQGWSVTGTLGQSPPFFRVAADIEVAGNGQTRRQRVVLTQATTPFALSLDQAPQTLRVDPEVNLMRWLDPVEIPPTVNALKASTNLTLVVAPGLEPAARDLVRGLGVTPQAVAVCGKGVDGPSAGDLLVVGQCPLSPDLATAGITLSAGGFGIDGRQYGLAGDALFAVFSRPGTGGRILGLLYALSTDSALALGRRITHYGKYSFLVFSGGRVAEKGTWPVTGLGVDFAPP